MPAFRVLPLRRVAWLPVPESDQPGVMVGDDIRSVFGPSLV
jgi:hypothetical protein